LKFRIALNAGAKQINAKINPLKIKNNSDPSVFKSFVALLPELKRHSVTYTSLKLNTIDISDLVREIHRQRYQNPGTQTKVDNR
jgi:hypothetical protein